MLVINITVIIFRIEFDPINFVSCPTTTKLSLQLTCKAYFICLFEFARDRIDRFVNFVDLYVFEFISVQNNSISHK